MSLTDTQVRQDLDNLLSNRTAGDVINLLSQEVDSIQFGQQFWKNTPLPLSLQAAGHTPDWAAIKAFLMDGTGISNWQSLIPKAYARLKANVVGLNHTELVQCSQNQEIVFYMLLFLLFKSLLLAQPSATMVAPLSPVVGFCIIEGLVSTVVAPLSPPNGTVTITGTTSVVNIQ